MSDASDSEIQNAFDTSTIAARIAAGIKQGSAIRQHFTPQFVLRKFLQEGKTHLCQLDVGTGRPIPVTVDKAASRRRFYSLYDDETGDRDDTIEGLLSLIESEAARALDVIEAAPDTITADQRVTVSYFAAAQMMRTPAALGRMQSAQRVVNTLEIARLVVDDTTFAEGYADVRGDSDPDDPAWLQESMRQALLDDRIKVTNERELSLSAMVSLLDDLAALLYQVPWVALRAVDAAFICSDSGMSIIDPDRSSGSS